MRSFHAGHIRCEPPTPYRKMRSFHVGHFRRASPTPSCTMRSFPSLHLSGLATLLFQNLPCLDMIWGVSPPPFRCGARELGILIDGEFGKLAPIRLYFHGYIKPRLQPLPLNLPGFPPPDAGHKPMFSVSMDCGVKLFWRDRSELVLLLDARAFLRNVSCVQHHR